MNRVDRLYIQVKRAYGESDKYVYLGFVDLMEEGNHKGMYRSRADLWDGKIGSVKPEDSIYSYHKTKEEAIKAIELEAEAHKPSGGKYKVEDVPIIVCDWGDIDKAIV